MKSTSLLFRVFLACFVCYAAYTLVTLGIAITKKENEILELQEQIEMQKIENEELTDMVENGVSQDYIEKIAREKLGLAYPNERIFVDSEN
ncbi:MAG: FtsB family cell division protein [Eubacteriales bacterium]|jgi:cell division protein FtsL